MSKLFVEHPTQTRIRDFESETDIEVHVHVTNHGNLGAGMNSIALSKLAAKLLREHLQQRADQLDAEREAHDGRA